MSSARAAALCCAPTASLSRLSVRPSVDAATQALRRPKTQQSLGGRSRAFSSTSAPIATSRDRRLARSYVGRASASRPSAIRRFATHADSELSQEQVTERVEESDIERAQDECDVCIVGGGPAGLSAAIRIKQQAAKEGKEVRVVLLEKGGEVGAHILSGAVIETRSLEELFPDWKEKGAPLYQPALKDSMHWLTSSSSIPIPHPPQMNNKGNYIISLSKLTRWLGEQAEELGVEIYPGFAAASVLYTEDGKGVRGVVTNEIGLDKAGKPKDSFEPGMEFLARVTLFAEGARGPLSRKVIDKLGLREGKDAQTYGLGIKEVWKVKPENHQPGNVGHTLGWPLSKDTYGGSWTYHLEDGYVSIGLVIGLDVPNPYVSPFKEFQRMKHHPHFAKLLEGGECVAYGARVLNEGGTQSIPKLTFNGGGIIGCSAGFVNVPKIKGTHTAMGSGILAADAAFEAVTAAQETNGEEIAPISIDSYQTAFDNSWIAKELYSVRNLRPSFHTRAGVYGGVMYSGIDAYLLKGRVPWTFHHPGPDSEQTRPASDFKPIDYPAPDGKLSFDLLTSVSRTGTNHAEDQPIHLGITDKHAYVEKAVGKFDGQLNRLCPAGVYEFLDVAEEGGDEDACGKRLQINSQNCIHCQTCAGFGVDWVPPEGSGGPKYSMT
ncbi:uncharacterized protein L969DRAFT_617551 [Mixia osmundae IAM 14324]|uniref:Electron transfer flavoprotein-ubiquinone oxidoreductase n=1 Tax=Mixia osmundae (strain CBS 9802 / IAM 14324 / JCM 22182 / KY 12970) TaxID=764103 RepID=G7E5F3_MIXOS|nr:uncharacterized protein L969DRAFT_617551 [Mixia osmundae IAM 14324]KEI40786.1 hypothetical protein L969DRAFT_617551 [Mixia osmundae IAM 14324]GAA98063.1 hypothetical protein E5Q_04744 [Mixia osmundae IAM 14324]